MSFLAPLFLLGALAIAAPIAFHLVRRTTRDRTAFSSVMFLSPSRPSLTHRSRLEHLWLLLLRALAIALLALGFAQPYFRKAEPEERPAARSRRVIVLVDVSASMRRAGLWAEARDRTAAILRGLGPADEAALFTFSRESTPIVSFEEWKAAPAGGRVALALDRLAGTEPGWQDDRLGDALIRAAETLAEAGDSNRPAGPRQIFLVGDLTEGSRLDSLQAYDWPKGVQLSIEPLKARNPTNAGIQLVADSPDADRMAAAVVRVRVRNAATSGREQFTVGWAGPEGVRIGPSIDVYVPPGQSRVVAVPALARAADMREITLQGDDEAFDNAAYVVPPQQQRWSVLYFGNDLAGSDQGPLFFLERAVPDNRHLSVKVLARAPSAAVPPAETQDAKMAFVTSDLTPATVAELRRQMLSGKTVLFAPSSARAAGTLSRLLDIGGLALEDVQPSDYALFGDIDFRHPLFSPFADPRFSDFTKIHIWKYRRLGAAAIPGARVVARFDDGDPALVDIPVGSGRLIVLLTGWNPGDSELAVSSKFVPLISSLLELAGGPSDEVSQATVGDPIPLPTGGTAGPVTVGKPDGTTVALPPGAARFAGALEPGIYLLTAGGRTERIGVNVAASVSRTEPLPTDELERYGAPGPASQQGAAQAAKTQALLLAEEAENRQKLWHRILAATLVVLLVESALAGWTSRQGAAPAAEPLASA